jgi:hypothetical protein
VVERTRLRTLTLQIEFVLRHTTTEEWWLPQMSHGLENRWIAGISIYGLEPDQRARALLRLCIDWATHDAERAAGRFLVSFATDKHPTAPPAWSPPRPDGSATSCPTGSCTPRSRSG